MQGMNPDSIDRIYLDPPFNSKADYHLQQGAGLPEQNSGILGHCRTNRLTVIFKRIHYPDSVFSLPGALSTRIARVNFPLYTMDIGDAQ